MNSTFIIFRLHSIILITSVYKIVASAFFEINMLNVIFSSHQRAFMVDRQILDCFLIASEFLKGVKRFRNKDLFLYSILRRCLTVFIGVFWDKVLLRKGFGFKWRR